jgi:polyhydroxybutyrate depolymerase
MRRLAVPAALLLLLSGLLLSGCGDDSSSSTGSGGAAASSGDAASTSSTSGGPGSTSATASSGDGGSAADTTSTGTGSSGDGGTGGAGVGGAAASSSSGGSVDACLQDLSAGHHEVGCEGGITYDVEIPAACVDGSCGLIVDIHGYTMTGDSEDENTGMRALGQERGYVIVQPTAPADGFGLPSWDQATHAPLVHTFAADIAGALPIDPARVHAMGFSQGGGMTFRLLCSHADFFASGAPIGALEGCEMEGANTPSEEVDVLQVHGRLDAVVSFEGVGVPQRDAFLDAWSFGQPEILESDDLHDATRWVTAAGTVYEFWEHDYTTSVEIVFVAIEGHCVPGGTDFDGIPGGYSCEDEDTFVFGQLAMDFFEAHPKD